MAPKACQISELTPFGAAGKAGAAGGACALSSFGKPGMARSAGPDERDARRRCGEDPQSVDHRGVDSVELETQRSFTVSKLFEAFLSNNGLRVSFDGFAVFV